jgi:hypothetical protein
MVFSKKTFDDLTRIAVVEMFGDSFDSLPRGVRHIVMTEEAAVHMATFPLVSKAPFDFR